MGSGGRRWDWYSEVQAVRRSLTEMLISRNDAATYGGLFSMALTDFYPVTPIRRSGEGWLCLLSHKNPELL